MVTANIFLHANFIVSDPVNDYTEMEIESVTARHAKITIDSGAETATIGSFEDTTMSINSAENTYEVELKNLDNNSYYLLDIVAVNKNDSKTSKRMYINTASNLKTYILRQEVLTNDINMAPIEEADITLTPQDVTLELDNWIEGLRDDMGNAIEEPVNAAERYTYLTTKVQGGQILRQTNHKGYFMFQALPNGNYAMQISKTGFTTQTNPITVNNNNIITGIWFLQGE